MKILFASRRPTYPFFLGGAEKSFYELASALAAAGHTVYLVGEYTVEVGLADHFFHAAHVTYTRWYELDIPFLDKKLPKRLRLEMQDPNGLYILHNFLPDFKRAMVDIITSAKPDVICTQLEGATEVLHVAGNWNIPVMHFVRDVLNPTNFFALGIPDSMLGPRICISNSDFVGDFVREHFAVPTVTIYPLVHQDAQPPRVEAGPKKRVVFVNPIPSKGGEVMFEVASALSEVEFELIPGWGMALEEKWLDLPNVIPQQWPVADMENVLARADLLLAPAQQQEAFGRTGIEAQVAGVPVVASRHSGILESLGDSAVLVEEYKDPATWIQTIRKLLGDPAECQRLREAGFRNVQRFSQARILEMFGQATEFALQIAAKHPSSTPEK